MTAAAGEFNSGKMGGSSRDRGTGISRSLSI